MTGTKVIIIRHGETEWNAVHRYQGQLDSPLTTRGLAQAKAIGQRLANVKLDAIYSSDLGRALATTREIQHYHPNLETQTDPTLRERDFGILSGLTRPEGQAKHPEAEHAYLQGDPNYRIPEGESLADVYERCTSGLSAIAQQHPGNCIAIITHGGVLGMILRHTVGIDLKLKRHYRFFNASYNEFYFENDQWALGTWGDIYHLQEIGTDDDF